MHDDQEWKRMAAASAKAFDDWRHRADPYALKRLNRDGFLSHFERMIEDGQPFDFDAGMMDDELLAVTPVASAQVPVFRAHLFRHWEEWKAADGTGLLLFLPVEPNYTHGHEWWKWGPDGHGVGEPEAVEPGDRWTLWDRQAAEHDPTHPAHGFTVSHGAFCDISGQHLGWQYHVDQNIEIQVNGRTLDPWDMNPSSGDPWNCVAYDVPLERIEVRARTTGIFTTPSGQYPEDSDWSEKTMIEEVFELSQIPTVFGTVCPDPQYGKNYSARLDHVNEQKGTAL